MSKHEEGYSSNSILQLILVIPGTILAFTLLISIFAHFLKPAEAVSAPVAAATTESDKNIKPVAVVEVAAADAGPHVDKSGEEVVQAICSACHLVGAMGSPKIGDKAAWGPRIAQGYPTLIKHASEGIRMMPARGGNPDLSDNEIAGAVAYMANQAGANFTAPKPAEAK